MDDRDDSLDPAVVIGTLLAVGFGIAVHLLTGSPLLGLLMVVLVAVGIRYLATR